MRGPNHNDRGNNGGFQAPRGGNHQRGGGRRNNNNSENNGDNKRETTHEPVDFAEVLKKADEINEEMTIRCLIPASKSGRLIGKGGEHAKALKAKHDVKMQIPDNQSPERILSITGPFKGVINFIDETLPKYQVNAPTGDQLEIRILIHRSQCGAIIGTAGQRIKEIREHYDSQVRCFPQPCPDSSDRVLRIKGPKENVIKILKIAHVFLESSPISGRVKEYTAQNYNPGMVYDYGGIADENAPPMNSQSRGRDGGYNQQGGYNNAPPANNYGNQPPQQYYDGPGNMGGGPSRGQNNYHQGPPQSNYGQQSYGGYGQQQNHYQPPMNNQYGGPAPAPRRASIENPWDTSAPSSNSTFNSSATASPMRSQVGGNPPQMGNYYGNSPQQSSPYGGNNYGSAPGSQMQQQYPSVPPRQPNQPITANKTKVMNNNMYR